MIEVRFKCDTVDQAADLFLYAAGRNLKRRRTPLEVSNALQRLDRLILRFVADNHDLYAAEIARRVSSVVDNENSVKRRITHLIDTGELIRDGIGCNPIRIPNPPNPL